MIEFLDLSKAEERLKRLDAEHQSLHDRADDLDRQARDLREEASGISESAYHLRWIVEEALKKQADALEDHGRLASRGVEA